MKPLVIDGENIPECSGVWAPTHNASVTTVVRKKPWGPKFLVRCYHCDIKLGPYYTSDLAHEVMRTVDSHRY